jgi:hypothetical protein
VVCGAESVQTMADSATGFYYYYVMYYGLRETFALAPQ